MGSTELLGFGWLVLMAFKKGEKRESRSGDPNGTRTHVSGVRGQRPRPLDDGATANRVETVARWENRFNFGPPEWRPGRHRGK